MPRQPNAAGGRPRPDAISLGEPHHLFFGNLIAAHFPIFFTKSTFSYSPPPLSKHAIHKTNKIHVYFKRNANIPCKLTYYCNTLGLGCCTCTRN